MMEMVHTEKRKKKRQAALITQRRLADPDTEETSAQLAILPSLPNSLITSKSVIDSRSDKLECGERGERALGEAKLMGEGEES